MFPDWLSWPDVRCLETAQIVLTKAEEVGVKKVRKQTLAHDNFIQFLIFMFLIFILVSICQLLEKLLACNYLSQRSWTEVMYSPPVCLSVSRITGKVTDRFGRNFSPPSKDHSIKFWTAAPDSESLKTIYWRIWTKL